MGDGAWRDSSFHRMDRSGFSVLSLPWPLFLRPTSVTSLEGSNQASLVYGWNRAPSLSFLRLARGSFSFSPSLGINSRLDPRIADEILIFFLATAGPDLFFASHRSKLPESLLLSLLSPTQLLCGLSAHKGAVRSTVFSPFSHGQL